MSAWRLHISKPIQLITDDAEGYVIEGNGPLPVAERLVPPPPPGDPADPPPQGDPLAPQPGEDTSAFHFPVDGPRYPARDFDRSYALDRSGEPGADYYAAEQQAGNPSIHSHANAGIIAEDGRTAYGRPVGALRLWVRVVAGESMIGTLLPVAPPHLIRRALKRGRLSP